MRKIKLASTSKRGMKWNEQPRLKQVRVANKKNEIQKNHLKDEYSLHSIKVRTYFSVIITHKYTTAATLHFPSIYILYFGSSTEF